MRIVETERLILREFTPDNAEDFYRIHTDAETMRFQTLPENYSVEVERYYLGKHIENYYKTLGFGIWAAILKAGFEKYGFQKLVAVIDPQNTASVRVAEKIGMRFERKIKFKNFGEVNLYTAKLE